MKHGWYFGSYRDRHGLHECCYGWVVSGYWYAGGLENKPYDHKFWGFVWAGKYTFGVGRITPIEPFELPDVTFIEDES